MLLALLLSFADFAEPYYLPARCGVPTVEHIVTAQNDDGTYSGRIYEFDQCSSGGRGSKPRKYATCQAVVWSADGATVLSHAAVPLEFVTATTCFE